MSDLQGLVDALADELQRSVVVNDPAVRMLCTSRHFGDEDEVRVRAVLQRDAGPDVSRYVLGQGVARWTRAGTVPPDAGLGLRARWCVPLRGHDGLLGLLMVIDADGSLTTRERTRIDAVAAQVAALLDGADPAAGDRDVLRLLDPDADVRRDATRALADRIADGPVAVTVLDTGPGGTGWRHAPGRPDTSRSDEGSSGAEPSEPGPTPRGTTREEAAGSDPVGTGVVPSDTGRVLRAVLDSAARSAPRRCLAAVDDGRGVLVQSTPRPDPALLTATAERMIAAAAQLSADGVRLVAGIGSVVPRLDDTRQSAARARVAVRGARLVPALGPVVRWEDLGPWSILLRLPDAELGPGLVPDAVERLLADPRAERHLVTARTYLDHAGSIPRTAAALHLHRTSLYYRLEQIGRITGLDLDDGRDRLLLHLGLLAAEFPRSDRP